MNSCIASFNYDKPLQIKAIKNIKKQKEAKGDKETKNSNRKVVMQMSRQDAENAKKEHGKEGDVTMDAPMTGNPTPKENILDEVKKQVARQEEEEKIKPEDKKTTSQAEIDTEAEKLRAALKVINAQKVKLSQQRRENDAKKIRCAGVGLYLLAHDREKFNELLQHPNFYNFIEAQRDKEFDKYFNVKREKAN